MLLTRNTDIDEVSSAEIHEMGIVDILGFFTTNTIMRCELFDSQVRRTFEVLTAQERYDMILEKRSLKESQLLEMEKFCLLPTSPTFPLAIGCDMNGLCP